MDVKIFTAFVLVSTTGLFPYNLFMNAHEYFYFKFRNVTDIGPKNMSNMSSTEETALQRKFEGFITLFGGVATIIGASVNLLTTNKLSNIFRVLFGHFTVIAMLAPTIFFTYVDTDSEQSLFFFISVMIASIASFGSLGLISGGILGFAATFPPIYMQAVMIGQAVAGILSALLSIFCQAGTSNEVINGRVYFLIALIWTFLSILCYYYLSKKGRPVEADYTRYFDVQDAQLIHYSDSEESVSESASVPSNQCGYIRNSYLIIRKIGVDLLNIVIILVVTLSAFPAVASLVKSTSKNETWTHYFTSVCCFLVFNMGDAIGRLLASSIHIVRYKLVLLCSLRVVFIPLIVACNVEPRYHSPTIIPYDGLFVLVILIFAISNGFCLTLTTINASKSVDCDLREIAGSMMNLMCVVSSLGGSVIGVILVEVI